MLNPEFLGTAVSVRGAAIVAIAFLLVAAAPQQSIHAQNNRQRGATVGGLLGAVAGGLIGDNNDEAGAGAVIGGAVGAVAGGLLGDAEDRDQAYYRQYGYPTQRAVNTYPAYRQTAPAYRSLQTVAPPAPAPVLAAVSVNDVITMSRSGLSPNVIMTQMQNRGVQRRPEVTDIIQMHQSGVPEPVITAMQTAPLQRAVSTAAAQAAPVVIQQPTVIRRPPVYLEQYHVVPRYTRPSFHYYRRF